MQLIGTPLGWIMHFCYSLVNNYGIALIMFTVLTRLVLLPLAIKQQKGMVKMAMFRPKMEEIQKKYAKNPNKMNEELTALYAREGYNPLSGCLPTLIQFPILFGLIDVIYNPLRHLLKMPSDVILKSVEVAKTVLTDAGMSKYSQEMSVINAVAKDPVAFTSALGEGFVTQIQNFDFTFFGLDMGYTPQLALNIFILIPIVSGLTSFMMSRMSMEMNAMPQEGSTATMNKSMMLMMPLMSVWIAFQVPAGVGIYWALSNLFMIIQQWALYKFYNPKEMAEKAKAEMEEERERERQEKIEARKQSREKQSERDKELEAEKAATKGKRKKPDPTTDFEDDDEDEDVDEAGLTQKEINRIKLAAARKRDAEKYGEEYVEVTDEDLK